MRIRKRHILRWIAVAFAATAVAAPTGQAVGPDDRAFSRQSQVDFWNYDPRTGEKIADSSPSVAPGDLARLWSGSPADQPAEIPYLSHGVGVGANDLGSTLHPDSRSFARSVRDIEPRSLPIAVVQARGFDWGDAVIGGTFGMALALLATGAILIAHRRRNTPATA